MIPDRFERSVVTVRISAIITLTKVNQAVDGPGQAGSLTPASKDAALSVVKVSREMAAAGSAALVFELADPFFSLSHEDAARIAIAVYQAMISVR